VSYFFFISATLTAIFFILMKIELQSRNIAEDYIFRHHFSFWSEFADIVKKERDDKKKFKYKIIFFGFNFSFIILFIAFLINFWD
jgi:hypothetical protein